MKRMYTLIALLLAFLGVAFFSENGGLVKRRVPRVGVLTLMHHPALDQIYKGFVDELAREGYHDGKNIQIEYQNANGDQSNLKAMASKLVNDNCNVIYSITTPAAQAELYQQDSHRSGRCHRSERGRSGQEQPPPRWQHQRCFRPVANQGAAQPG